MKIIVSTSVALFGLILIQTILVPYLNKHLNREEREQYDRSQKVYLVIAEIVLAIGLLITFALTRNIKLSYILGFLVLSVVFYDSFSDFIKIKALNINEHAKKIILVKNITYVIFSIIFVGSLFYQQGLK